MNPENCGVGFPSWHALLVEEGVTVNMRVGMSSKHECEELKDGVWLERLKVFVKEEDQTIVDCQACQCG